VHDLRKIEEPLPAFKVRPLRDTRTDLRPKKQLFVTRLEPAEVVSRTEAQQRQPWSAKSFFRRKLFSKSGRDADKEVVSAKRECFVLEELACVEVVPVEDNHYERVSL
jgi:hypothetical protein